MRLIHRKSKDGVLKSYEKDPYLENEEDPINSKALKSCLWEIEALIKHHYDERVRSYCKVFKTEF